MLLAAAAGAWALNALTSERGLDLSRVIPAERMREAQALYAKGSWLDHCETAIKGVYFGHELLPLFKLDPELTNLNHGSFGTMPREVDAALRRNIDCMESRPDDWFRGIYQDRLAVARKGLAEYLDGDADSLAFVLNASDGINAVLNSCCHSADDGVLTLSCAYPMVKNAIQTLEKEGRCHNLSVALQLPCQRPEDIVAAVATALRARRNAGDRRPLVAAVFSHLVSTPGIILPIADIARVCKANGVQRVVVDAAHAIGQVKVRLSQLCEAGVDYYVTNVHKWMYGPKGTAVLMVKDPAGLRPIRPLIVSSEAARAANNRRQFDYIGTRDYTAYCAIPDALAFRMKLGDERILHYLHSLAQWAGHYLATLWATEIMTPDSMVAAMINVRLPTYDAEAAGGLYEYMARKKNSSVVMFPLANGTFWLRLSAQVYISREDIHRCAEDISDYLIQRGAFANGPVGGR